MVAATSDSTQHPHPSSSTSAPLSAEEEALKRNTDCVYFLASPLTCKKGAECEYRHSEYARVNPRDCWYWLNGSCLNPKCAFRHPPLDGLLGTPATAAPVAAPLPPQIAVPMLPPPVPAYNTTKQAVPCIFFQQGYCMKGEKCAFSHGTNPVSSKAQQAPSPMPAAGQPSSKKPFGSLERCSQDQRSAPNLSKPNFVQSAPKIVPDPEKKLPVNFARVEKRAPVTRTVDEEALRYNGNLQNRPTRMNHHTHAPVDRSFQHDKESDEFLRESSPGFDVLVDHEGGEADYYHGEDHQFGNTRTTREKQFDTDFNSLSEIDQRDHPGGYDSGIGWKDQRRNPSDQRTGYREGRGYRKSESPDRVNESDLRHRLSKQRRVNGLRSVVGNDSDERRVRHSSLRHEVSSRHEGSSRHEVSSSIGGRLKGRIKFPGRSDFDDGDREKERGRDRSSRLYADRPRVDYGRLRGERTSEDRREASGPSPSVRREFLDGKNEDFAGQNSLSGLKSSRIGSMSFADQQGDANASFEGPKPLSELLKRKRVDDDYDDSSSSLRGKEVVAAKAEVRASSPPSNEEEEKAADHPLKQMENEEEDVIVDEADAEHELEEGDEGEYEYEQVDEEGEYANYEEGGNAEEEEYIVEEEEEEEDDDDDFAKKVGVMFT